MRTLKLRLLEMLPDVSVFLDKDDLKTGAGAEYIDASSAVLVFATAKYFQSRACARELFRARLRATPLITILEPDRGAERGGLRRDEIEALLTTARFAPHFAPGAPADQTWADKWALDGEVAAWGDGWTPPTGAELAAALFCDAPIEWNRFSAFQVRAAHAVVSSPRQLPTPAPHASSPRHLPTPSPSPRELTAAQTSPRT